MARRERPPRRPDVHVLRLIAGELQMADVRAQVALPFATEFENFGTFTPSETAEEALNPLLDQLISWTRALKTVTACRRGPFWPGTPDGAHPRLLPSMGRLPKRARQVLAWTPLRGPWPVLRPVELLFEFGLGVVAAACYDAHLMCRRATCVVHQHGRRQGYPTFGMRPDRRLFVFTHV